MTIGERILKLRNEKGLRQIDLARLAGIPVSTLHYIEGGTRDGEKLTVFTVKRLAKALGVTVDYLIGMYAEEDAESELVGADMAMVSA